MSAYDLAVIGGGISGVGVALEASRLNIKTALFEKERCLSATSNNSLRIIHSGFRYLQNFALGRVLESTFAQHELHSWAPEYFTELPCLLPLQAFGLKSKLPIWCAAKTYASLRRLLTGAAWPHGFVSQKTLERRIPNLADLFPNGAFLWNDLLIANPEKFHAFLRKRLDENGVGIFENSSVLSVKRDSKTWMLGYDSSGQEQSISCKAVVNCAGPGATALAPFTNLNNPKLSWCKAFNLVVSKQLDTRHAIALQSKSGRLFFAVPRGDKTAIGTYYLNTLTASQKPDLSTQEIQIFIDEVNGACPVLKVTIKDVVSCDLGLLPAQRSDTEAPYLQEKSTISSRDNYTQVISTKYTTFISQGRNVLSTLQF